MTNDNGGAYGIVPAPGFNPGGSTRSLTEQAAECARLLRDGREWTTAQLTEEFDVLGFHAPFVVARRKSDGQLGSLVFAGSPRAYFAWREYRGDPPGEYYEGDPR